MLLPSLREIKHKALSAHLPVVTPISDPFFAPIRAERLTDLPAALVIAYGWEDSILVEGEEYVRRLKEDGVAATISLYPNAVHGFFCWLDISLKGKSASTKSQRP